LRNAVSKAKTTEAPATRDAGGDRYRQMTEGLVWGENFTEKDAKPERYSDMASRVRLDFPEGWSHRKDDQTDRTSEPEGGRMTKYEGAPATPRHQGIPL
jgi:hypothetical protein